MLCGVTYSRTADVLGESRRNPGVLSQARTAGGAKDIVSFPFSRDPQGRRFFAFSWDDYSPGLSINYLVTAPIKRVSAGWPPAPK